MIAINEVVNPEEKSRICNAILRALPDWFGVEASIVDYVQQVREMPFFAAFENKSTVGFVALKRHNPFTAEIYVMGLLKEHHRKGIGKRLIARCEQSCIENNIEFLTVKTLDETRESESYRKTRQFYLSVGFKPLEVFPLHWDKDNPCLFMAKCISVNHYNSEGTV